MTFDPKAWLAENLDANGDLAPPWARFPEIPAGSIGWRMGAGEGWKWAWWDWVKMLPADRESRVAYLRRHPPAPRPWASSALALVDPTYNDEVIEADEADEARWAELEEMFEREGLVGDDVAFGAWVARHPRPEPPWGRDTSLALEVRYGSRELTFLCRWAAGRRADALGPWLSNVGTPPPGWRRFVAALREGAPPAVLPHEPRERLGVLVAATGGCPPPPWMGDEDPAAMEQEFEEETTHAGAWSEWVMDVFDDAATFSAYRAAFPAAPQPWERAVEENFRWLL